MEGTAVAAPLRGRVTTSCATILEVLVHSLLVPALHQVLVPHLVLGHCLEQLSHFAFILRRQTLVQLMRLLLLARSKDADVLKRGVWA